MKEDFNPNDYYPKDWPENPFHDGEVQLQKKAGVHDHIMTYASEKFKPYMPKSHREFYATLPFLAVAAIDDDGQLWATLLFAENPEKDAVNFVQSPDPLTLEIHTKVLRGDALENAFQQGSDLSVLGMDWGRCTRNKANGRVLSRDDCKISFRVDQSIPHCPKYITSRNWTVAPVDPVITRLPATTSTTLSTEQARCIDIAESVFVATCYRGEGEDPRYGNDVNYRGGPAGFIRREGMNKIYIPEFAGNHHFNTLGNLVLDNRIGVVVPLFDSCEMLQLSGTAVIQENFEGSALELADSIVAESVIEFTIEKIVHLPVGSLPIQWATASFSSDDAERPTTETAEDSDDFVDMVRQSVSELHPYKGRLTDSDKVVVMQGWNCILDNRKSFSEALELRWRMTVASEAIQAHSRGEIDLKVDYSSPMRMMESYDDPLAHCLGPRLSSLEEGLMFCADTALRSICPETQMVVREGYRPYQDDRYIDEKRNEVRLDCRTLGDYLHSFARAGILPSYWVAFVRAFEWAIKTHVKASQDLKEDIERGSQSALLRAIVNHLAIPAIMVCKTRRVLMTKKLYDTHVKRAWNSLNKQQKIDFGENFYVDLLSKHPVVLEYFSSTDMDVLAGHFGQAVGLICNSCGSFDDSKKPFRKVLDHLGEIHRIHNIPTFTYPLLAKVLIGALKDTIQEEVQRSNETVTANELNSGFAYLYMEVMAIVYYTMLEEELFIEDAKKFLSQVRKELGWTTKQFDRRVYAVEREIHSTGTYIHSSEEIEAGFRMAWRNSSKCIGREPWKTMVVKDCRHVVRPSRIFQQVHAQLESTKGGQCVVSVFAPQQVDEALGTRFFSSQFAQFACYRNEDTGEAMGDPENLNLTQYLVDNNLWSPPEDRTPFDTLPLVLKLPGEEQPVLHELPAGLIPQVLIEHPKFPDFAKLGYYWPAFMSCSNFRVNLGGIVYPNIPFTRPCVSVEIARSLTERYNVAPAVAKVVGIDTSSMFYRQLVLLELELAIVHSFQKAGHEIFNSQSIGESFCTHVSNEKKEGRECPAQLSSIGGLVGPTSPAFSLSTRDFAIGPHFERCADGVQLQSDVVLLDNFGRKEDENAPGNKELDDLPRILILYGSETGKSEAIARRLKRKLSLIKPVLMSLNEAVGLEVAIEKGITHVICVCSTFGKGNHPRNAQAFFESDIVKCQGVKYAVLALGSSVYPDFCKAGRKLHKKLSVAGLKPMMNVVSVDEAVEPHSEIESWIAFVKGAILPPTLEAELLPAFSDDEPPRNSFTWLEHQFSADKLQGSICIENKELIVNPGSFSRSIRKISFEAPGSYATGDHLAVQPLNSEDAVNRFLRCFEWELLEAAKKSSSSAIDSNDDNSLFERQIRQAFKIERTEHGETGEADTFFRCPTSLYELAKKSVDFAIHTIAHDLMAVMKLAIDGAIKRTHQWREALSVDPLLQEFLGICLPLLDSSTEDGGGGKVDSLVARFPTVVHLFERFKSLFFQPLYGDPILELPQVLVVLTRLRPRYYSISSSSRVDPQKITITVGVLREKTSDNVLIEGVCSNYLKSLQPGIDETDITIVTSSFRLPETLDAPIIMVGAGTGIAPMVGFLEERQLDAGTHSIGNIDLFFGCRSENDFIYEEQLRSSDEKGILDLHLALSRSQTMPKKYVQNLIGDEGEKIANLLMNPDTHYYVCGDARMADGCFEACIEALRKYKKMSRINAVSHLKGKSINGTWQADVWGIVSHYEAAKKIVEKERKTAAKIWFQYHSQRDLQT